MRNASSISFAISAITIATAAHVTGCFFNPVEDCQEAGECATGAGGGGTTTNSGGAGGSITPPGCIPSENSDPVEDDCGIFVSIAGDDNNPGTKSAPVATLAKAINLAQPDKGRVYACSEEFAESVTVPPDGKIYGGLDCASDWKRIPGQKSTIAPAADLVPVTLSGGPGARIEDVTIKAADATMPGGSSIAVIAEDGATADLVRCDLAAGSGATGAVGASESLRAADGENGNAPAAPGCTSAGIMPGGVTEENAGCIMSFGGEGGIGSVAQGGAGAPGQPGSTPGGNGQVADCTDGGDGSAGLDGEAGPGAIGIGAIAASGYLGAPGATGMTPGMPGHGGGGGGGARGSIVCANVMFAGHGGGSGAAGGCGGAPGGGGGPGGSSIGLLSHNAQISLMEVIISTAAGGAGGIGGVGQEGGFGGSAGGQAGGPGACAGGKGGKGGYGGPGGGGLGGHSIGIAFLGMAPAQTGGSIGVPGTPGAGGPGAGAAPTPEAMGASGIACKTIDFSEPGSCQLD